MNLQFSEKKFFRITFRSATEVSECEETAIVFLSSFSKGSFENKNMLQTGPAELIEKKGIIQYLFLCLKYSMDDDGLTSIFPFLSILLRPDGTPLMNV